MKKSDKKVGMQNQGRPIHNYPVVPEESPRHRGSERPPVTRGDLGADFRNAMQFCLCDWRTDPIYRQALVDARLGSVMSAFQWYSNFVEREGRADLSKPGTARAGWEEAAQRHADMGLFIWTINSMADTIVPKDIFDSLCRIFGPRFLGFDEGEWDGAYYSRVAAGQIDLSPQRSREDACRHYLDWLGATYERHQRRMTTISSLGTGCHYAAELGTRMVGLELSQGALPSSTVMISFCRGAGRQYDVLMGTGPSVWSFRGDVGGVKCYPLQGQPQSLWGEGYLVGSEHGATLGLLKRLWWVSYMSGASLIAFEASLFPCDVRVADLECSCQTAAPLPDPITPESIKAHFTPLGWLAWECSQTARLHPLRGVSYQPVAFMLPFAHGWAPPNRYTPNKPDCVWGNIPYGPGDYQIDRFMDRIYPGYKLANKMPCPGRDERGIVTNTPLGDLFDVILDTAPESCLDRYRAVILLGAWDKGIAPEVAKRLEAFMADGGLVVADRAQWPDAPGRAGRRSGRVEIRSCGKGRLVLVGDRAWQADQPESPVFAEIAQAIEPLLEEYVLIAISGRPIYWTLNVTDQPDELLVTLCNNSSTLPWEGMVHIKGTNIVEVEEWLAHGEADITNGGLRCGVPANDVRIFRLKTKQPFLNLRFRDIPWKKLGFGVPEWPAEAGK